MFVVIILRLDPYLLKTSVKSIYKGEFILPEFIQKYLQRIVLTSLKPLNLINKLFILRQQFFVSVDEDFRQFSSYQVCLLLLKMQSISTSSIHDRNLLCISLGKNCPQYSYQWFTATMKSLATVTADLLKNKNVRFFWHSHYLSPYHHDSPHFSTIF